MEFDVKSFKIYKRDCSLKFLSVEMVLSELRRVIRICLVYYNIVSTSAYTRCTRSVVSMLAIRTYLQRYRVESMLMLHI